MNARSTQRYFGRRRGMEVWRRMYLYNFDLYYRFLATRLCQVLRHKEAQEAQERIEYSLCFLCLFVATN